MKKNLLVKYLLAISIMLSSAFPVYAFDLKDLNLETIHSNEKIVSIHTNNDLFESISQNYSLDEKMDTAFINKISNYADVEKNISINNGFIYETYTFKPNVPQKIISYESGNTEKIGSIYSITYVTADESGSKSGTSTLSDLTFKNTINYSYYTSGYNTAIKVISGTCSISRFLESDLRNLEIKMGGIGVPANSGPAKLSASKSFSGTISVGKTYTCTTGWTTYYYESDTTSFSLNANVTYNHGNSSYTVSSNTLVLTNA